METLLERMTRIVGILDAAQLVYGNEYDLQAGIHHALKQAGFDVTREVVLSHGSPNRIDLFLHANIRQDPGIGIEVKVNSSLDDVTRQLTRYAGEASIAGLILVTTLAKHHHIPYELAGKPVRLVSLVGAGL